MNACEVQRKTQRSDVRHATATSLYPDIFGPGWDSLSKMEFEGRSATAAARLEGIAMTRDYIVRELDKEFADRMVAERAEWGKTASVLEREAIREAVLRLIDGTIVAPGGATVQRYGDHTRGMVRADLDRLYPSLKPKPKPKLNIAALQLRDGSFWRHKDDPTLLCGCTPVCFMPFATVRTWYRVTNATARRMTGAAAVSGQATVPIESLTDATAATVYLERIAAGKEALAAGEVTL